MGGRRDKLGRRWLSENSEELHRDGIDYFNLVVGGDAEGLHETGGDGRDPVGGLIRSPVGGPGKEALTCEGGMDQRFEVLPSKHLFGGDEIGRASCRERVCRYV